MTRRPRVVIIDDSASSRAALGEALTDHGCDVVGRAMDGGLGLRLVLDLEPDAVTLDLEMPRMDGFTFLRIITQQRPTPVIVVTSDARAESALMALELGAKDFVVKPGGGPRDIAKLGESLAQRIFALAQEGVRDRVVAPAPDVVPPRDVEIVVVGASTGGPKALRDVLSRLFGPPRLPVVIAQHMPPRFTTTFAERLRRTTGLDVAEAREGEPIGAGQVRVIPGACHGAVERRGDTVQIALEVAPPESRHVPSVDRLLLSAASSFGPRALAVVLTGMGRDGAVGAAQLARAGAPLWAEDAATAVVDGMPRAAADAHPGAVRLPLDQIASGLADVLRGEA